MSIVFSKKEKRSRSSTNESNNSFVKNVTSRVSGLLPATITKWFSSPSSSSANGSALATDATDSSTEDEAPESPLTTQPPAKRMRYTSPGALNQYTPPEPVPISHVECNESSSSHFFNTIQSPPGRNTFRLETDYVSTPYSAPTEEINIERSERGTTYKSQHSIASTSQSVAVKRKSIFDTPTSKEDSLKACAKTSSNTMRDPKQPSFKPALFGSPFYPGRTMYGGASSTYINQPNIKQRKVAHVNDSKDNNDTVSMSYSARRVMDLLENYSSPLSEAKRIPHVVRKPNAQNDTLNTSLDVTRSNTSSSFSYKTQELYVPSIASILQLKQRSRLMDTTKVARQIIASHSSTLSSYKPYAVDTANRDHKSDKDSSTTKMKTRVTRPNRNEQPFELPKPVELPSAVLQIDTNNLPKFSFGVSPVSSSPSIPAFKPIFTSSTPAPASQVKTTPAPVSLPSASIIKPTTTTTTTESSRNEMYKFSSPVTISSDMHQNCTTPPTFTFGSPERSVDKPKAPEDIPKSFSFGTSKPETVKSSDWKCPECWIQNKADVDKCACCGTKKQTKDSATETAKCSVCKLANSQPNTNKCSNCTKTQTITNPLTVPKAADSSKWKCEDCWVVQNSAEKCACCGSRNLNKSSAPAQNKTKSVEKDWKCEDCWITNKSSVEKCAACGGAKSGAKTGPPAPALSSSPFFKPADNKLAKIAKSQKGDKWECSSCLVRNESDKTACICCATERAGTVKEPAKTSFHFGMNTNTSFKFGIDPKVQESNIAKKTEEVKPVPSKKVEESETNNNIVPNIPTFTFSLPNKKNDETTDSAKSKVGDAPKVTFSFGIPKQVNESIPTAPAVSHATTNAAPIATTTVTPATAPTITERAPETTKPVIENKEKPQEVTKIEFKSLEPEAKKPPTGLFGTPNVKTTESPSLPFSSFMPTTTPISEKKEASALSNALTVTPVTSVEKTRLQSTASTFSFSASGVKPGLFAAPTSTLSTTGTGITFGTPLSTPVATTAPTMSLFSKPEATATTTLSPFSKTDAKSTPSATLFQKSEATTTSALAPTTPAPLFSFSGKPAPVADKPSFNFSFGNSSSTESAGATTFGSFKPPTFGATESVATSNTFALSAPASSANTSLPGNGLQTGNGPTLSAGNGLTIMGSSNTTNPIGGNLNASQTLFNAPAKDNVWANNSSTNMFTANNTASPQQKPAFSFGTPTPFGSPAAPTSTPTAAPAPLFGSTQSAQPTQNLFGLGGQSSTATPLFASGSQSQPASSMFGSGQASASTVFGSPSVGAAPSFGAPQSIPSFEAPSLTPAQAPTFNFGAPQSSGVFGFGQQPQQLQQQQTGMYSFNGGQTGLGQTAGNPMGGMAPAMGVQFNMGRQPAAPAGRRVRKAMRRTTPR